MDMLKVTVYTNEARGSMCDGFDRATAELEAFSFEVDREIASIGKGRKVQNESIFHALDEIYTMLNVGGDFYPHTSWSQAYRDAGNRSLSKGDVVLIEGYGYFAVGPVVGQEAPGEEWVIPGGYTELHGGDYWVVKGLARYVAKYGTRRPWEVAV